MKVLGIAGSLREDSYACMLLNQALRLVEKSGVEVELLDLRQLDLPFCIGGTEHPQHTGVKALRKAVQSSRGLILVTPEYHGSLSGVLKNALDLLHTSDVEGKVVATVGILGGAVGYGATNTLSHICRNLRAWVVPRDLQVLYADRAFDENGELNDPLLTKRLEEVVALLLEGIHHLPYRQSKHP